MGRATGGAERVVPDRWDGARPVLDGWDGGVLHGVHLSVRGTRGRDKRPPCAGMTQIRFDGRRLENLPLSPAHRTPVFTVNILQRSSAGRRPDPASSSLGADPAESTDHFVHRMLDDGGVKGVGGFSLLCGKLRKVKGENNIEPLAIISNRSSL